MNAKRRYCHHDVAMLFFLAVAAGLISTSDAQMSGMGGLNASTTTPTPALDSCISNPALASCSSYVYPSPYVTTDLDSLCKAMPFMTMCTLYVYCNASTPAAVQSLVRGCVKSLSLADKQTSRYVSPAATACGLSAMYRMQGSAVVGCSWL